MTTPTTQPDPVLETVLRSDFDFLLHDKQRAVKLIEEAYELLAEGKIFEAKELLGKRVNIPVFIETYGKKMTGDSVTIDGNTSDGYHTFNELYEFRKMYNAALFSEWAACGKFSTHKSWRHHSGELCFGGGWFIVVAVLPQGQISNHYEAKDWDLFAVPEVELALFEYDGHTSTDVLERLKACATSPRPLHPFTADNVTDEMIAVVKKSTPMQGVVTSERIAAAYNAVNTCLTDARKQTLEEVLAICNGALSFPDSKYYISDKVKELLK